MAEPYRPKKGHRYSVAKLYSSKKDYGYSVAELCRPKKGHGYCVSEHQKAKKGQGYSLAEHYRPKYVSWNHNMYRHGLSKSVYVTHTIPNGSRIICHYFNVVEVETESGI